MFNWIKKQKHNDSERARSRPAEPEPQFRPAMLPPRRSEVPPPPTVSARSKPISETGDSGGLPQDHEIFLEHLTNTFGQEETILRHESPDGGRAVTVFVYRNFPNPGMITGVTYGLSLYDYPDWRLSRPELVVSVGSSDPAWAFAAAYFAANFRGKRRFCYGDVFTTDTPLAEDTQMDGFLVFAQSVVKQEQASIQLSRHKVHLSQLYPIYRSELELYSEIGLERFWKHPGFRSWDVGRSPIVA